MFRIGSLLTASLKSVILLNILLFSLCPLCFTLGSLSGMLMEVSEHRRGSMLYWLIRSWEALCGEFKAKKVNNLDF